MSAALSGDAGPEMSFDQMRDKRDELLNEVREYYNALLDENSELRKTITSLTAERDTALADKARVDWLEAQTDGTAWTARRSSTGRGFRLHNTTFFDHPKFPTAREAIDAAMKPAPPTGKQGT